MVVSFRALGTLKTIGEEAPFIGKANVTVGAKNGHSRLSSAPPEFSSDGSAATESFAVYQFGGQFGEPEFSPEFPAYSPAPPKFPPNLH